MTDLEILNRYYQAFDAVPLFDEKHPLDPTISRREEGLPARPMNAEETRAVCELIRNGREDLVDLLLFSVAPGTTKAAYEKAIFLGKVASGTIAVSNLSPVKAVDALKRMKGGHNIPVLIELLANKNVGNEAVKALSSLVLIHHSFETVATLCRQNNSNALAVMENWARATWYENRPPMAQEIKAVVFKIPDEIEASTDFLSHSKGGHTRTDVPAHAKRYCMTPKLLEDLELLKKKYPDKRVVLVADKIGTSSSRKSGMNNVEWLVGIENDDTFGVPDKKTQAFIFAGSVLGPIFGKTAQDMGSVVFRVNTHLFETEDEIDIFPLQGKIVKANGEEIPFSLPDASEWEQVRAGGGTLFRMGRILTEKAQFFLGKTYDVPYQTVKVQKNEHPMTAAQKILAKQAGLPFVFAGQTVCPRVDTVASQDTTGGMTVAELQGTLCATRLAVPLFLQSQCHNAAMGFRVPSVIDPNEKLVDFVRSVGGIALKMGDGIIHSWLNELVVPATIVVGGDSHTRTPTALSFPLGSGGVAEAAATGVTEIVVPESVLVVIKGEFNAGIGVRDLVNYIPYKAKKLFGENSNVFEGSIIEYQRKGKPFEMIDVFRLTNSSAERSAAASYFEQEPGIVADYIEKHSIPVVEALIDQGYDNDGALARRLAVLKNTIVDMPDVKADDGAVYKAVVEIDLAEIEQPYIACPHTPDNVRPLSELQGTVVDFGFIGSCMSGKADFECFERIIRDKTLKAESWVAVPTRLLALQLEEKGVLKALADKGVRIEVPGCSLCMGNQERVVGKKNVLTTSTRNFKARMGDEASVYLASSALQAVALTLGCFPDVATYFKEVKNG